jgi:hypothetical protein
MGSQSGGNGYCLVLLQTDQQAGKIRIKASSKSLEGNEVVINVDEADSFHFA